MKIIAITPNKKFDALVPSIIEGMYDCGVEVIASDTGNSIKRSYTENEILNHSKDADYIFSFFGKVRNNKPPKYHLMYKINKPEKSVYIDGSEWTASAYPDGKQRVTVPWGYNKSNIILNSQVYESKFNSKRCKGNPWLNKDMHNFCKWYFKRECYKEDLNNGIIPLNISTHKKYFGNYNLKKDIDIFCSFGHLANGLRLEAYDICKKLEKEGYRVLIANNLSYQDYLSAINRSYIGLSAWGAGNSCMRMWEIFSNGTCCFIQRPEIEFINKFSDGINCVEYSNPYELESKIRYYLTKKDECIKIGQKGLDFVKSHHSGKSRFEYILNCIKG
jgi:hypothetical protein